jgi:hypothetical protein
VEFYLAVNYSHYKIRAKGDFLRHPYLLFQRWKPIRRIEDGLEQSAKKIITTEGMK